MYEDIFAERLAVLRLKKDVSARNMSLSIGQSADYINKVENKKLIPSMTAFFNICEYLEITPQEFFETKIENPKMINEILENLNNIDEKSLNVIFDLTEILRNK